MIYVARKVFAGLIVSQAVFTREEFAYDRHDENAATLDNPDTYAVLIAGKSCEQIDEGYGEILAEAVYV